MTELVIDKEKQIDEIAGVLKFCKDTPIDECHTKVDCRHCLAEQIYNAGYRKQIEGRWENRNLGDIGTTRTCSHCRISQTVNIYNGKVMFNYCPYCGAKMKGE